MPQAEEAGAGALSALPPRGGLQAAEVSKAERPSCFRARSAPCRAGLSVARRTHPATPRMQDSSPILLPGAKPLPWGGCGRGGPRAPSSLGQRPAGCSRPSPWAGAQPPSQPALLSWDPGGGGRTHRGTDGCSSRTPGDPGSPVTALATDFLQGVHVVDWKVSRERLEVGKTEEDPAQSRLLLLLTSPDSLGE